MSFVGLKQIFETTYPEVMYTPELTIHRMPEVRTRSKEIKRRLVYLLQGHFGISSIQVGAFQMQLSEEVPDQHLIKASQYLVQVLRQEAKASRAVEMLEDCVLGMV